MHFNNKKFENLKIKSSMGTYISNIFEFDKNGGLNV
jgi:hypothetical protein